MGFQHGLSGLNASSKNLDVIGNNIANSGTVGFKASQAQFADVYAASLSGAGAGQIGIGVRLATVAQQFTQGNISVTNNPLDVAINGRGFFMLDDNGSTTYSRNGQFQMDKEGYIVSNTGLRVKGYQVERDATGAVVMDSNGNAIITGALGGLQISQADIDPQATSEALVGANLDSNEAVPTAAWVDPDPTVPIALETDSFNHSTSMTVYDSLGNSHTVSYYFVKTATPNTWDVYATVDGNGTVVTNPVVSGLPFTPDGRIDTALYTPPDPTADPATISIDLLTLDSTNGATTPLEIWTDFSSMTQFGAPFSVNQLTQNGYTSGRIAGFNIGADGVIMARYTNGQTQAQGQFALANFTNPQGLQSLGDNQWAETSISGQALVGAPETGSLGSLQSSSVEESNVDMTAELVNMIVAQRAYQANAQTIKTQDQILQTLVNLR